MDFAFQVDLRGVVDLLSQHLYSGPDVFVRELLQNAVDALTAAGARDSIRVEVDRAPDGTWVHVEDRGIGLTAEQVHEFLSTIGSSSKRDLLLGPRVDFLGRFGIGLLSCFMVSDEVSLVTRSRDGATAVRWVGRSDGSYRLDEAAGDRTEPGTRVSLRIRPDMAEVVAPGRVRELVSRYGGLLPYRIEVHGDGSPVTFGGGPLPWVAAGDDRELLLAVGRDLLDEDALDVVPLSLPAAGLTGAAYVLKSSPSPQARQRHRVYLKRMLLATNVDRLVPDWAFFVRVVVDSDALRPLASREGLYEDETLAIVKEAIGDSIRRWLVTLADHEPARLQDLVRVHALALKALAVHDDELLALFARWLPVETSMGRMTILETATRSPHVRYAESLDTFRQLVQVAAAQGVLLVNGGYTYDAELLARLPSVLPGVSTEAITPADLLADLADVSEADRPAASALAARGTALLADLDCEVTVRDFSPSSVPCLYLLGDAVRFRRSAEEAAEMSGGFWGSLVSGVVGSGDGEPRAQLCLNFRNPLVRGLPNRSEQDLRTALEVLCLQAMLLGRHPLRGRELSLLSRSLTKLLEGGSS